MSRAGTIILLVIMLAGGCAVKRAALPAAAQRHEEPAARPTDPANLALDEIQPQPTLSTTRPADADDDARAPLDAIELFAQARDAMLQIPPQRQTAINLLEKAVKLDPKSYELRFWLGQAYTAGGPANDQSIAAYEAAAAIDPDHVIVHSELGRQYLARGETRRAIDHLMLATQTSDYGDDDSFAAVVDFYLGKALQRGGYDRAALQSYEKLIDRLQVGGLAVRSNPELAYLVQQPELLFVQVGELMEKRGRQADAIKLYELAADRRPDDFGIAAHVVRAYAAAGRRDEATRAATDAVRRFRTSPESLNLLKEIFRQTGGDDAVARELDRLRREFPNDRVVLYALVDVLSTAGKTDQATQLLSEAARGARYETDLVRRLFRLYDTAGDVDSAARLLIEALAARPDNTRDLSPLWQQLLRPWRRNHLTVARLGGLEVSPQAQASKLFWVSEMARVWNRELLARSSLEQAVKQVPPFAPAYRVLLGQYWLREDWDARQKREASQKLVSSVERQGDNALAAELRGDAMLNDGDAGRACAEYAKAQELGGDAPDLRLAYATALRSNGDSVRSEQVLWKLTNDKPTCEEAYLQLFRGYLDRHQTDAAFSVLKTWLGNDPASSNARILEGTVLQKAGNTEAAQHSFDDLFEREPDNGAVLVAMAAFYSDTGRTDDYIKKLEANRIDHPENRTAVEQLVLIYAARNQLPDATRVLDAARTSAAASGDSDLLYYIGGLYSRIGQKETTEQILDQIVQRDPDYAPACNDLGYSWAEQGKNLVRAETLIRVAVQKEPDNQSYLDSLGWVLYKRGRFDQARAALESAIGNASLPDPIVLDHLGDALYRLDKRSDAAAQWKRSQDRIGKTENADDRDELKQLRLQLQQKIKQAESGQPASVSPVADEPARQAKN